MSVSWSKMYADRTSRMQASDIRELLKLTARPEIISLAGGLPAPELFPIDEYRQAGRRVLALGAVQYVWSEGGEVADSTPIALEIEVEGGVLGRLTVHDDVRAALAEFESGSR